jgi:prolipoprotein diacylglyceryl transferase
VITTLLGSLPSPDRGVIDLGPVPLHMYGLLIAVGVLVAAKVAEVRWIKRGGNAKDFGDIVVWAVISGVIGARLYHVVTDYQLFTDDPLRAFEIWEGGLGIWGAIMGGAVAVLVLARRRKLRFADIADAAAPGLAFAQSIGRWGNWFNQELFGAPSSLPWAIEISPANRPAEYRTATTFQPMFLYESLYCLALGLVLLWVDRRFRLKRGQVFALYCAGYTAARFVFEEMRVDPAHLIGPLRLNAWVSLVIFGIAVGVFLWLGRHGTERPYATERHDAESDRATGAPTL